MYFYLLGVPVLKTEKEKCLLMGRDLATGRMSFSELFINNLLIKEYSTIDGIKECSTIDGRRRSVLGYSRPHSP